MENEPEITYENEDDGSVVIGIPGDWNIAWLTTNGSGKTFLTLQPKGITEIIR